MALPLTLTRRRRPPQPPLPLHRATQRDRSVTFLDVGRIIGLRSSNTVGRKAQCCDAASSRYCPYVPLTLPTHYGPMPLLPCCRSPKALQTRHPWPVACSPEPYTTIDHPAPSTRSTPGPSRPTDGWLHGRLLPGRLRLRRRARHHLLDLPLLVLLARVVVRS